MNRLWCLLIVLIIWPEPALSQLPGNATLVLFPGVPTGNCNSRQLALNMSDGSLYTCAGAGLGNNGTWQLVAGAGGGAVSSVFGRTGAIVAMAADYGAYYAPIGAGGAVSSVFGRSGAVTAQSGDYTVTQVTGAAPLISPDFTATGSIPLAPTAAPGTNTTQIASTAFVLANGGVSGGTVNALAKYSGTNALAPSNATEDGNLLSYFGAGGIVGNKFSNGSGSGGFQLESAVAPLPPLPGVGNSSIVSGPDGFYVSNANNTYTKLGQAGGATAGVSSFNTRTGAVVPASGDYTVAQVGGAAPLASPSFTGSPQAVNPPTSTDNSQAIATTNWVQNYVNGATVAQAIGHSLQTSVCASNDSNTATPAQAAFSGLNIQGGDTVLMTVTSNNSQTGQVTYTLTDDGNNTWSTIDYRIQGTAPSQQTITLIGTGASAAKAATQITLTQSVVGRFTVCLTTYVGVAQLGTPVHNGIASGNGSTLTPQVTVVAGGYMFCGTSSSTSSTVSWTTAGVNALSQRSNPTGAGNNSTGIGDNTSATAATLNCNYQWGTSGNTQYIAIDLRPGIAVPAATPVRVNLYKLSAINDVSISSVVTCSTAQCPDGYYRITILGIVTTTCTTGTAQVNLAYINEVSSPNVGLLSSPMTFTSQNVVYATRPFHHNGTGPINISTTGVACTPTAGTGAANLRLTIERLQ